MQTFTLKSGTNKGNRRIWIEGNRLLDCGLTRGTALYRLMQEDGTMIFVTKAPTSKGPKAKRHTIAGKADRPILDLCGRWVTDFMGDHTHFEVKIQTLWNGVTELIIEPVTI